MDENRAGDTVTLPVEDLGLSGDHHRNAMEMLTLLIDSLTVGAEPSSTRNSDSVSSGVPTPREGEPRSPLPTGEAAADAVAERSGVPEHCVVRDLDTGAVFNAEKDSKSLLKQYGIADPAKLLSRYISP